MQISAGHICAEAATDSAPRNPETTPVQTASLHYSRDEPTSTGEGNTGINQYLLYTVDGKASLGGRYDWSEGVDYNQGTLGFDLVATF